MVNYCTGENKYSNMVEKKSIDVDVRRFILPRTIAAARRDLFRALSAYQFTREAPRFDKLRYSNIRE